MNDLRARALKLAENHEKAKCRVTAETLRELVVELDMLADEIEALKQNAAESKFSPVVS